MIGSSEVAPGIFVSTSRYYVTNSTFLVGRREALLIDPAWLPTELEAMAAGVRERSLEVVGGFATHAHHDHLLWHPGFGDAPRWASTITAQRAVTERTALVDALGAQFPQELVDLMGRVQGVDAGIPPISTPSGFEIELIVHDGHAPGHTAVWLPDQRVLVAGDMLSDVELPLPFDPDDLPSYVEALDRLAPYAAQAAIMIPGHGHVGPDALARLDADRRYIDDVVRDGASADPRQANDDMDEAHEHMLRVVRGD